jgi:MFS family permease
MYAHVLVVSDTLLTQEMPGGSLWKRFHEKRPADGSSPTGRPHVAVSFPVGWLADRLDTRRLLVLGYLLGTATAVLAAVVTPSLWPLGALLVASGLTLAFEDALEATIAAALVPPELRGTGHGALEATNGVGDLLSSTFVGVSRSAAGPKAAFTFAAVVCFLGAALLGGRRRFAKGHA